MRGWAKLSPSEVVGSLFPSCLAFRGDGERKYKHRVSSVTGHTAPCTEELHSSETSGCSKKSVSAHVSPNVGCSNKQVPQQQNRQFGFQLEVSS
ncbi:hypothetical protein PC118_g3650 [Phytophthora cactorum]|uniref:Uncharacterized protein n=1 Tax=Phytophthora cactorum TaxID=29920 RepID=A0A8T1GDL8_9STRA|nr:hypothetical protein PC118_g3650 [Phytophthora cactorum]